MKEVFKTTIFGGVNRDRTGDLMNAIHALYQLSYDPIEDQTTQD